MTSSRPTALDVAAILLPSEVRTRPLPLVRSLFTGDSLSQSLSSRNTQLSMRIVTLRSRIVCRGNSLPMTLHSVTRNFPMSRMHYVNRNRYQALATVGCQKERCFYYLSLRALAGRNLESLNHLDQIGQRVCLHLLHRAAAVSLYCVFCNANLSPDLLVEHA